MSKDTPPLGLTANGNFSPFETASIIRRQYDALWCVVQSVLFDFMFVFVQYYSSGKQTAMINRALDDNVGKMDN